MKTRWMIAAGAALALGVGTLPFVVDLPFGDTQAAEVREAPAAGPGLAPEASHAPEAAEAGAVCDANAKPANLDFTIKDMDGNDVALADYKGKVVLLDFWATWCGPCKTEIPHFVELQEKYRDQGVAVLGFSVDDPVDKLKAFAQEYKMNYPVLVGRDREDVQEAYGPIWGIPVTFVIGRDGNVCKKHMGMTSKEQFEKEIKALL